MSGRPKRILYATHNAGKVEELIGFFEGHGVEIVSAARLGLPVPEETEETFEGNARLKAIAAHQATGMPALADDSGLCVDALSGRPGVRTADWAETPAGRDFRVAMERVHKEVLESGFDEPWHARFVCVLAYTEDGTSVSFFRGEVDGRILWPPRGREGHGYDPIFAPAESMKTFSEMTLQEKNALSHRARAARAFVRSRFT